MADVTVIASDVTDHTLMYGVDIFPPLPPPEMEKEAHRAHLFFTDVHQAWPHLYGSATVGAEFKITTKIEVAKGTWIEVETFRMTDRGPVFTFPRKIGAFRFDVDLKGANPDDVFQGALATFFARFPGRKALRVGLVRNVIFATGKTDCTPWIGPDLLEFNGNAKLVGGQCLLIYRDDDYNIRLQIEPLQMMTATVLPALGAARATPSDFCLGASLDVNTREMRELEPHDIQGLIDRANGLWPDELLSLLNRRRLS